MFHQHAFVILLWVILMSPLNDRIRIVFMKDVFSTRRVLQVSDIDLKM